VKINWKLLELENTASLFSVNVTYVNFFSVIQFQFRLVQVHFYFPLKFWFRTSMLV